jgi:hypothetical protein
MSLEHPDLDWKLRVLMASKTKEHITTIIKNWNEYCKANDLKESMIRGYSKFKKDELIDFILSSLADEEKQNILANIQESYIDELFKIAKDYIEGNAEREKLQTIKPLKNGLKLEFKGWQWENETVIELSKDNTMTYYNCSCRTGQMGGFCPHLFTGILTLINDEKFNLERFPFAIPAASLELIEALKINKKEFKDVDMESANIVLGDDYFISVDGNLVTLKWKGERAGKTTKDVTEEKKPVPVATWVARKVVDKILAPLRHHPSPREIFKDTYGIVKVILDDEKLVKKLLSKFEKLNDEEDTSLPTDEGALKEFLTQHL